MEEGLESDNGLDDSLCSAVYVTVRFLRVSFPNKVLPGYFPRLILLIPHISLIAIILATYPYPSAPGSDPLYTSSGSEPTENEALPPPPTEGSIPWQANIQGIQNLMGALSVLSLSIHSKLALILIHLASTLTRSSNHTRTTSPSPLRTSPPLAHRDRYPPIHRLLPIHHTHHTSSPFYLSPSRPFSSSSLFPLSQSGKSASSWA